MLFTRLEEEAPVLKDWGVTAPYRNVSKRRHPGNGVVLKCRQLLGACAASGKVPDAVAIVAGWLEQWWQ